ncbi:MAG: ketosynthase [Lysobacteraceae bacterium]
MSRWLPLLLGIAFPLLAHASVVVDSPEIASNLALAAVACLGALLLWPLRRHPAWFVVLMLALLALTLWLSRHGGARLLLMLPPVLFPGALGLYFARSLGRDRMPLIERIVRAIHGGELPDPRIPPYARRLTLTWALLLLGLAGWSLWLALMATPGGLLSTLGATPPWPQPLARWSLFANLLNYVIIAAFFLLEYAWRRRQFPNQPYDGIADFFGRVARLDPSFWRGGDR